MYTMYGSFKSTFLKIVTTDNHTPFADTAAILILPQEHPIMIIEINIFLCEQLISMIIMGCPGGNINMAAVSAKRSMYSS